MSWMEWITISHSMFVNLPVGVAILLPWALIASQRAGRGIRPWWVTCRYLGWAGVLSSFLAAFSGYLYARSLGMIPLGAYLTPKGAYPLMREHQALMLASLGLGLLFLKSAFRKREEYQSFGVLPLILGLLWSAAILVGGWHGNTFAARAQGKIKPAAIPVETPAPKPQPLAVPQAAISQDPETKLPLRLLDYQSLEPIQLDPIRSAAHGNRWIRVWVNAVAAEAYRAGVSLPAGSFVAMNSLEDRWGRPGPEPGPLYGLEIKSDGTPLLTFYWAKVSEKGLAETKGENRVYWRENNPGLQACMSCHSQGMVPASQRNRIFKKKPSSSEGPLG